MVGRLYQPFHNQQLKSMSWCSDSYHPFCSSRKVIGGNQHLMDGCSGSPTKLPASDISALEESTFKVGRLSMEERKEKIHRYLKKRNERNFSKKIKYACRKTLADSRPRIRGRFAKNDEFREAARHTSNHHEFDEEEEVKVKEEDILDSSDILAHISGVNSFKYNYTLESWI
ncbi:two-component response regulator-like PRR1 [Phoenix dactylifera]|uniref:Two-component response regulator-like PRR1 n=1 Tax=Phoenix dactylifera TaxID=42345 RepID=A0A8B8J048_PHODC|nr:two-component response regulator-like PRR1 [Phoenix dactylifera]